MSLDKVKGQCHWQHQKSIRRRKIPGENKAIPRTLRTTATNTPPKKCTEPKNSPMHYMNIEDALICVTSANITADRFLVPCKNGETGQRKYFYPMKRHPRVVIRSASDPQSGTWQALNHSELTRRQRIMGGLQNPTNSEKCAEFCMIFCSIVFRVANIF